MTVTTMSFEGRDREWQDFWEGLDFILSHFTEPIFPRNVMTKPTIDLGLGQQTVFDRPEIVSYFEGALRQDCRISAYPNYEVLKEKELLTPTEYKPKVSILFIDFDIKFLSDDDDKHGPNTGYVKTAQEAQSILSSILANIKKHLNGAIPSILWTGGGYHIYLPLDVDYIPVFEELPDFEYFTKSNKIISPSEEFMRYAAKKLTNGKSDNNHNPSFKSCLIRIPNSINSKYSGSGDRQKVRLIQRWNGIRARPTHKFMIDDFHAYLIKQAMDEKVRIIKARQQRERFLANRAPGKLVNQTTQTTQTTPSKKISWIEDLIQNKPLDDRRKLVVSIILSRYLINVRQLSYDESYNIIWNWLDKCIQLRRLTPSRSYFDGYVRRQLQESQESIRLPMGLSTMQQKYPELYQALKLKGGESKGI